ncbi:hypothetical protein RRF57_009730 [Xylaria bambusicola]|uniref:Clr5 domain-containing protein n=1 Tax=Xylaria bambusicola TaxID=326684 RepID=A0AAN7UX92_9PEZI
MASREWDQHKALIIQLYAIERRSLQDVIKNQYIYQLNKWGAKKNLKREYWKHLNHQLRERAEKQTEVTLFDVPLSLKRVRRSTQRYNGIPTAADFGKSVPSRGSISEMAVRTQTPPLIEMVIWPPLPWFDFKNRIFPRLKHPSALVNTLFATFGSDDLFLQYDERDAVKSLFKVLRNPPELRSVASELTKRIPQDSIDRQQREEALEPRNFTLSMATDLLRLMFFNLSNNHIPNPILNMEDTCVHDRLVMDLVVAVSSSNPDMIPCIFSDHCVTTNAIKRAVYGSAIRDNNYEVVSLLLKLGVHTKTVVFSELNFEFPEQISCYHERGRLRLSWLPDITIYLCSGIIVAAFMRDIQLAEILLREGAKLDSDDNRGLSALDIAAYIHGICKATRRPRCADRSKRVMSFMQALEVDIGDRHFYLRSLPVNEDGSEVCKHECGQRREPVDWLSENFEIYDGISCTPLNVVLVLGHRKLIERLLQPALSRPTHTSVQILEEALLVSCLVGDIDTALKIIQRHPGLLDDQRWETLRLWLQRPGTQTPQLLSIISGRCLCWPEIGRRNFKCIQDPPHYTLRPPTAIQALYGLSWIAGLTALCDYTPRRELTRLDQELINQEVDTRDHWPSSPLQCALYSNKIDSAKLLLHQSNLIGGDGHFGRFQESAPFSNNLFLQKPWATQRLSIQSFKLPSTQAAAIPNIIPLYFSSGGFYQSEAFLSALKKASKTDDYSMVRYLASHRPPGDIDIYETASLISCIRLRKCDLIDMLLEEKYFPGLSQLRRRTPSFAIPDYDYYFDGDKATPLCWAILTALHEPAIQSVVEAMIRRGYQFHESDMHLLVREKTKIHAVTWALRTVESIGQPYLRALLLYSIHSDDEPKVVDYIRQVDTLNFSFKSGCHCDCLQGCRSPLLDCDETK